MGFSLLRNVGHDVQHSTPSHSRTLPEPHVWILKKISTPVASLIGTCNIVPVSDNFVSPVVSGMHVTELADIPGGQTFLLVRACTDQLVHLLLFITHATFRSPYPSTLLPRAVCRSPITLVTVTHDNCFYLVVSWLWMIKYGNRLYSPSGLARVYEQVQSYSNYVVTTGFLSCNPKHWAQEFQSV